MRKSLAWLVVLGALTLGGSHGRSQAAEIFDNEKLISMLEAGISLPVVQKKIETSICQFRSDTTDIIKIKASAEKGKWDADAIDALQIIVIEKAGESTKRLRDLVERFVNHCVNYQGPEYEAAMRDLLREGKGVVPYLLHHIEAEDERKRAGVMDALSKIGDKSPGVVKSVTLMLNDRNPGVRKKAAEAVASLHDENTINELIAALERRQGRHMDGVGMALGYLRDPKAIGPLTTVLAKGTDKDGRLAAAFSLGYLRAREPASIKALLDAILDDSDLRLRAAAARACGLIGEPSGVEYIKRAYHRYQDGQAELVAECVHYKTANGIEFLIECIEADRPDVRKSALEALPVVTGEQYDNAEEWRAWWSINKSRPQWIKTDSAVKEAPQVSDGDNR